MQVPFEPVARLAQQGGSQKGKSLPFWPKSSRSHQGLGGMEQEGKKWKGEHSRALLIIHVALAKTAL